MDEMRLRVALLGASGFVGGHLLRYLRAAGVETRAVVRRHSALADDRDRRLADICDVYALRSAFDGCDAVVHAALGTNDEIVGSVAPVYAAAQAVGVRRLVYISTGSVHGQSPAPGTDERSRLHTRHPFAYNNAKVRAERKLQRLRNRGTVELVILRPTIVFGPGSRWVFDVADALRAGTAYLVDGGRGICNSIYVDNLGHAVTLAIERPGVDREVFLVGDRETVTWRDLHAPIAQAFGRAIDTIPSLSPPSVKPSWRETYLQSLRTSEYARWIVSSMPRGLKATLDGARRAMRGGSAAEAPLPVAPAVAPAARSAAVIPSVPREIAELQRCIWRLPHDKAVRQLGYEPPVSFAEGCRRSVEWLLHRHGSPAS